jgi:hypothetical protein
VNKKSMSRIDGVNGEAHRFTHPNFQNSSINCARTGLFIAVNCGPDTDA